MSYNNVTDWTLAIADAIRSKDGSSDLINHQDFPARISAIPQGSVGGAGTGDVRFLDYDGTVVESYSASEFAELDSLPSNPTHSGLTAQGWNWSLTDAKAHVASYGQLDIGQMYVTDDGKTRIYVSLTDGTLNPTLGLGVNGSVDVDWGDGSEHSTLTGTSLTTAQDASHVYATAGDYVIALTVTGSARLFGSSSINNLFKNSKNNTTNGNYKYLNAIQSVHLGSNISIGKYAFQYCYSLASISLPNTLTSIATSAFRNCYSLASVSLPNTVASTGNFAFQNCYSLASISLPNTLTSIGGSVFYYCYNLASVNLPNSLTSIGDYAFYFCYSLASVSLPNTVASIGNFAFQNCYSLASISLPNTLTSIGADAFNSCYSLASISLPNTVTSIGATAFRYCYGLETLVVPATTATFGANAFNSAQSLEEVTFLGTPTTMPSTVFSSCTKLTTINVPWSEGDVANAPWGATNATINYDYTG